MNRLLPVALLLAPLAAQAAAPAQVPVTGFLTDDAGQPIDDQIVLDVKLYTDASGGTPVWSEFQSVRVDHGHFTVYLGAVEDLGLDLFRDADTLYVGLTIDGAAELSPRTAVATSPYAAYAAFCDDAATVGGIDPNDLRLLADPVDWSAIPADSLPAGLADGDDDTTYSAGVGVSLSGTEFAADRAVIEGWARGVAFDATDELRGALDAFYAARVDCTAGNVLLAAANNAWTCADPTSLPLSEAAVDALVGNNGYAAASVVASLSTDLSALDADVNTAQADIADLQDAVAAVQTGLDDLTTTVEGDYLPLAGGTLTGNLAAPKLDLTKGINTQGGKVRRDFLTWNTAASGNTPIHIKTNIPVKSYIMYRLLVEGYNYGVGQPISSDAVGYTYGTYTCVGSDTVHDYAPGVTLTQYCSTDGFVVLKLTNPSSFYFIGFGVSGWFTNPTGTGHDISAQVFQQSANL